MHKATICLNKCLLMIICFCFTLMTMTGCMSKTEAYLRKKQLENQANHPSVYDVITLEGAITIEIKEGGKAVVRQPNQPFKEVNIPDGIRNQTELIQHLVNIGAITVLGWKALNKAGGKHTTINNNNAPATGE